MEKGKIKILFHGDAVVPTGFARVLHSIQEDLPKEDYDLAWLGVNYKGDPHKHDFRLYPAFTGGDLIGFGRLQEILEKEKPDVMFILNDAWVIARILSIIKDFKRLPQIVTYFPVDSTGFDRNWFNNYGLVARGVTYTEFGKKVVEDCGANINISIVPHGVNTDIFKPLHEKELIRKRMLGDTEEAVNAFIFLNANRNQPRKRIDATIQAFAEFAKGKTEPVKLYLHMGLRDSGWDINRLAKRYGLDKQILVSCDTPQMKYVDDDQLNVIYNACEVGLNTSVGEGWGLTNVEHAVTGAPQIVGRHSACKELFDDCGLTVEPKLWVTSPGEGVISGMVDPIDVAIEMEKLYSDKNLYTELSEKGMDKFTNPKYSWKSIAKTWDTIFKEVVK